MTQTSAPDGFDVDPNPQQVTIASGETATANFVDAPSAPAVGSIDVTTKDDNGDVVPGACYVATDANTGTSSSETCDDNNDGVTTIENRPRPVRD